MCVQSMFLFIYVQVPRLISSKGEGTESESIETVLSAFTSIYSGTTVGSLAVIAFVSSLCVEYISVKL